MSRSYKKHPCFKDQDTEFKRLHNRAIGRQEAQKLHTHIIHHYIETPSHGHYRKLRCPYDISDYCFLYLKPSDYTRFKWSWASLPTEESIQQDIFRSRMK